MLDLGLVTPVVVCNDGVHEEGETERERYEECVRTPLILFVAICWCKKEGLNREDHDRDSSFSDEAGLPPRVNW